MSMMLRNVLRVVPSVSGNSPALNSWINLSGQNIRTKTNGEQARKG